jgi:hypothetical protein
VPLHQVCAGADAEDLAPAARVLLKANERSVAETDAAQVV